MLKNSILLVLGAVLLVACCINDTVAGSGKVVSKQTEFKDFNRIEVSSAFQVEITRGDSFKTEFKLDDNLMQYLKVNQVGSTLKIGMKSGQRFNCGKGCMQAFISMPELRGLELSGATEATISGFNSGEVELELSGASSLRGDFQAEKADMDLSGASRVKLTGSAKNLELDASGASDAELEELVVKIANVDLSGASDVTVNVSESLSVDASGASTLTYLGNATMKSMDTSGASSIRKKS